MIPALILACALVSAEPTGPAGPSPADREAYQAARARAGRDPEANVQLALWCEAHGLYAERLKHLSLAALADPQHAVARALLGLVAVDGRWGRPESVADRARADARLAAIRLEYESRRNKSEPTAADQWKLARWCEEVGLAAEATAHDTAVTRIDPSRSAAWKKLGCRKFEGRWLTPEQIEATRAARMAQDLAEKKWRPILARWKDWLDLPTRRAEAEAGLLGVSDPLAVRSIYRVFTAGGPKDQARAVQLFGQVDSTDASRALVGLAVFGRDEQVRRSAIETLRNRDVRGVLDPVILALRDPIKFAAQPSTGLDSPGMIFIEGAKANFERYYPAPAVNLNNPRNFALLPQLIEQATQQANRRFADDVQALIATNLTIEATNQNALAALKGITGKDLGLDAVAWMAWWTDKKGYAFQAPPPAGPTAPKPTITEILAPYERPHNACFGAGTPVLTAHGPVAIEDVKVGDRLLTQDTTSGALSYQPTLAVFHNAPAHTLRLRIGGDDVVATGIHRFWKAGQGWVMARELKVGDPIRGLGGIAPVESISADKRQAVFNLEVARGADFFVGKSPVLVHDNNLVEPVARPFDAAPDLRAITGAVVEK